MKQILIFTDGSCLGNPGPGGWAAILRYNKTEKEIFGGFALSTNNRMELTAAIMGLLALKEPCNATIYTDSKYLVDSVEKGWLVGWQKNSWRNASKKPVKNQDLWQRILPLLSKHHVKFCWVKGHDGHVENERCDIMAKNQAARIDLPPDPGFDPEETL